mmetsp:Transcript_27423/g.91119  ORF Transcript_27423/g.91119 Transcript_27423/m.91119 type:complete len:195 (-) Transcript_27423:175-759(-)
MELLEEAAFYRLGDLCSLAARPPVGQAVVARICTRVLAERCVGEPLHHDVCGQCHPPGSCWGHPVACGIYGTVKLAGIVCTYHHPKPRRASGGQARCAVGDRHGVSEDDAEQELATSQTLREKLESPRWFIECRGLVLEVTESDLLLGVGVDVTDGGVGENRRTSRMESSGAQQRHAGDTCSAEAALPHQAGSV